MGILNLKPKYTVHQVSMILKQMLEGLSYLHSQNVIHRDIKNANILMAPDGTIKFCDFGLSRKIQKTFASSKQREILMTPKVVTRWYRAPELLLGDNSYSFGIDVWSLGCCLAEIISESKPIFNGENDIETFKKICERTQTQHLTKGDLEEFSKSTNVKELTPLILAGGMKRPEFTLL